MKLNKLTGNARSSDSGTGIALMAEGIIPGNAIADMAVKSSEVHTFSASNLNLSSSGSWTNIESYTFSYIPSYYEILINTAKSYYTNQGYQTFEYITTTYSNAVAGYDNSRTSIISELDRNVPICAYHSSGGYCYVQMVLSGATVTLQYKCNWSDRLILDFTVITH